MNNVFWLKKKKITNSWKRTWDNCISFIYSLNFVFCFCHFWSNIFCNGILEQLMLSAFLTLEGILQGYQENRHQLNMTWKCLKHLIAGLSNIKEYRKWNGSGIIHDVWQWPSLRRLTCLLTLSLSVC